MVTLFLCAAVSCSRAALFTNTITIDAFVRSNAPAANYGGAGSLTISGATATNGLGTINGIADSFIRFNTATLVTSLNSQFEPENWVINGVSLRVIEAGAPNNNIFARGKGAFAVSWISNDDWLEGTGMPMTPTADGIVYTNERSLLTNTVSLGTFTNAAANSTNSYPLALPPAFTDDISAGGDVSLYLTAASPEIGFTFDSQNFNTATQRPVLIISAVAKPSAISLAFSGSNPVISLTNGIAGQTYILLTSTNPFAPISEWTSVATNVPAGNGPLSILNPGNPESLPQQFFILETQ